VQLGEPARLQIKPGFSPDLITSSIDLQIEGTIDGLHPSDIRISAFGDRLRLNWQREAGQLRLSGFTPSDYLKTSLPFSNIDLIVTADQSGPHVETMSGRATLRGVVFSVNTPYLVYNAEKQGSRAFRIAPRLAVDMHAMLSGREPGFTLGTSDLLPARDALADLLYSKMINQLTNDEADLLDQDLRFFADSPDAGIPLLARGRVAKSVQRVPAGVKKKHSPREVRPLKSRSKSI
jgi:hypothetical protein